MAMMKLEELYYLLILWCVYSYSLCHLQVMYKIFLFLLFVLSLAWCTSWWMDVRITNSTCSTSQFRWCKGWRRCYCICAHHSIGAWRGIWPGILLLTACTTCWHPWVASRGECKETSREVLGGCFARNVHWCEKFVLFGFGELFERSPAPGSNHRTASHVSSSI